MKTTTFTLSELQIAPENPRTFRDEDMIETMAESLLDLGLLHNLGGYMDGDTVMIVSGGFRLAGLRRLAETKRLPVDAPLFADIPVFIEDKTDAIESALASNEVAQNMDPADRYRAYSRLHNEGGVSIPDIARRYLTDEAGVKRILALAGLAKPIFEALSSGEIGLDTAKAYAGCSDTEKQIKVFKEAGDSAWAAKRMLRETSIDPASGRAKLVTKKKYLAEGGVVETDLFENEELWTSFTLFEKLAADAISAKTARLLKKGWAEVHFAEGWEAKDKLARKFDSRVWGKHTEIEADARPDHAIIWDFGYNGKPDIDVFKLKSNKAAAEDVPAEAFPKSFVENVRRTMGDALLNHMDVNPHRAARVMGLLALNGALEGVSGTPSNRPKLKYQHDIEDTGPLSGVRMGNLLYDDSAEADADPAERLKTLIAMDDETLDAEFARILATKFDYGWADSPTRRAAFETLSETTGFEPEDAMTFGPDILKALTRDQLRGVIEDASGKADDNSLAETKKGDLVKLAVSESETAKWIPPFMRSES